MWLYTYIYLYIHMAQTHIYFRDIRMGVQLLRIFRCGTHRFYMCGPPYVYAILYISMFRFHVDACGRHSCTYSSWQPSFCANFSIVLPVSLILFFSMRPSFIWGVGKLLLDPVQCFFFFLFEIYLFLCYSVIASIRLADVLLYLPGSCSLNRNSHLFSFGQLNTFSNCLCHMFVWLFWNMSKTFQGT